MDNKQQSQQVPPGGYAQPIHSVMAQPMQQVSRVLHVSHARALSGARRQSTTWRDASAGIATAQRWRR